MKDSNKIKSVITCDMEGRVETFNKGAEQIFGYSSDEVIGKMRVSNFSPGNVVLSHVATWLKTASKEGDAAKKDDKAKVGAADKKSEEKKPAEKKPPEKK